MINEQQKETVMKFKTFLATVEHRISKSVRDYLGFPHTDKNIQSRVSPLAKHYGVFNKDNTLQGPGVLVFNNGDFYLGYFNNN